MLSLNRNRAMPRGQALVLFSFTLLLLVLMVTMTLSFGTKAKEKMELQLVADSSAYSLAVATARTYNMLAVNNRVMLAHMVAMLGVNSAASFASLTVPISFSMFIHYLTVELPYQASRCNWRNRFCGCWGALTVLFRRIIPLFGEWRRVTGLMRSDVLLGAQANRSTLAVMVLYAAAALDYGVRFYLGDLRNQRIPRLIAGRASGRYVNEWGAVGGGASVAQRESGILPIFDGAINVSNLLLSDRHAVYMAMAARGHPFTAGRSGIFGISFAGTAETLAAYMRRLVGNDVNRQLTNNSGNAYFGTLGHSNNLFYSNSNRGLADDHMYIVVRYSGRGCRGRLWPVSFFGLPLSPLAMTWSRAVPAEGEHVTGIGISLPNPWPGYIGGNPWILLVPLASDRNHFTSGACLANCPSAWTNFVDMNYNFVTKYREDNNWNQPKLPVTVFRDMRRRPNDADPWTRRFTYRFTPSTGTTFDTQNGNGIVLRDGTDVSLQTAFSTGIAYFHRANHLKEPPNLFSPFWRAGLTRGDVDRGALPRWAGGDGDIEEVLRNSNVPWASDAFTRLWAAGFRGIP